MNNQSSDCDCIEVANPGSPMEQVYTYYANRNLHTVRGTTTPWFNIDYTYDALNRLTQASGSYGTYSYSYDGAGNRLAASEKGKAKTYTYLPGTNRLVSKAIMSPSTAKLKCPHGDQGRFSHESRGTTALSPVADGDQRSPELG